MPFALLAVVGPGPRRAAARCAPRRPGPRPAARHRRRCAGAYWLSSSRATPGSSCGLLAAIVAAACPARVPGGAPTARSWRGAVRSRVAAVVAAPRRRRSTRGTASRADGEFLLDPFVRLRTRRSTSASRASSTAGYPPQVPGVSGFPLGYHLGPDLVRAAALRFAGVRSLTTRSRASTSRWARWRWSWPCARAAARAAARRRSRWRSRPGRCWPPTSRSSSRRTRRRTGGRTCCAATCSSRSRCPTRSCRRSALGLGVARGARPRTRRGEGRGWLVLSALLAAGGAVLQGLPRRAPAARAGPARSLLGDGRHARRCWPWSPCHARSATAALVLGQGGADARRPAWRRSTSCAPRARRSACPRWPASPSLVWALLWIVASLGLRVAGPARRGARAARAAASARPRWRAMALCAWPLGLLFRVSAPEMLPGQTAINDAAYLVEQGGAAALDLHGGRARALAGAAAARLRPAAGGRCWRCPRPRSSSIKKAGDAAGSDARAAWCAPCARWKPPAVPATSCCSGPGARYPPLPVLLAGRRVPYERFTPYLTQFVAARGARAAARDRLPLLPHRPTRRGPRESPDGLDARFLCLYAPDRVRFDLARPGRRPIHDEPGARCYRLIAAADGLRLSGSNTISGCSVPRVREGRSPFADPGRGAAAATSRSCGVQDAAREGASAEPSASGGRGHG